jgi:hypothetical protein
MPNSVAWKISLPALAPRPSAVPTKSVVALDPPQKIVEAQQTLSAWLSPIDMSHLKDRDLVILASETVALCEAASKNPIIWKAIPGVREIASGERLVEDLKSAIAHEEELGRDARATCEFTGLEWDTPASANIQAAKIISERYSSSAAEIAALSAALTTWTGVPASIHDAVFIMSISSSLRHSDIPAMSGTRGAKDEVDRALGVVTDLDKAAAELNSEFSFDPSDHAPSAFGGIARAFASGKAQDFLSATRKLGIRLKGPDQAQRAASLLRTYVDALNAIGLDTRHADVFARARLSQSILRRADVLDIDLQKLSPTMRDVALLDFSAYPADTILSLSSDAQKLIEDNAAYVPAGTSINDLADELNRQVERLQGWVARQQRGLALIGENGTHEDVEIALRTHPSAAADQELALQSAEHIEPAEKHLQWLHEATMLPLSDEQLDAFVDHAAKQAT